MDKIDMYRNISIASLIIIGGTAIDNLAFKKVPQGYILLGAYIALLILLTYAMSKEKTDPCK